MKEERDPRFEQVNELFQVGAIKNFSSIFKYIPKSVVAKEMGTNNERFTRLMLNPIEFQLAEIKKMAGLFGQEFQPFLDLVLKEIQ